jgi:putative N-acetylmannosamine-6-phosphate epimerase
VITPDFEGVKRIAQAGATIIAMDVTDYPSDIAEDRKTLIDRIHNELGLMVMADISTASEAKKAAEMGVDAVSTTLAGYVPGALHSADELYKPNLELVRIIADMRLPCALVVEGRIWGKDDLIKAFELGADAVVIGKAITNPMAITRYFLSGVPEELR